MNNVAKTGFCALYKYSGLMSVQESLTRWMAGPFMSILAFHRVTDEVPEDDLTVGTARFEQMCGMLKKRFHVVPLAEVFSIVRSGAPFPARMVAITFDDGYRDNLFAAQTLARHGLPACFFLFSREFSIQRRTSNGATWHARGRYVSWRRRFRFLSSCVVLGLFSSFMGRSTQLPGLSLAGSRRCGRSGLFGPPPLWLQWRKATRIMQ